MTDNVTDSFAPWNFKWVQRNELAIMGYPKNEENIRYLVDRGIKHLVSLSPEKQPPFEHFPLKNWTWTPIDVLEFQPPSLSQILSFINLCYAARAHKESESASGSRTMASLPPWNFKWIVKNELAIMGYPKNKENIRYLEEQGITHLVSVSPEKQPPFEHFPYHFRWTPIDILAFEAPTLGQIHNFINICKTAHFNKEAVGVHCRMGRGRSGVMAACFLVRFYDMRPEYACTAVRIAQPGAIETYSQERAVHGYYDYIRKDDKEHEPLDEVDVYIKSIPRPHWDWKPRRKLIFDPDY